MLVTKGKKCASNNTLTESSKEPEDLKLESNLLCSAAHIVIARAQHLHAKKCIRLNKEDKQSNLYFHYSNFTIAFNCA